MYCNDSKVSYSRYDYITLLDIDEVITPIKNKNWADMMEEIIKTSSKVKNETRATNSWFFRNVYFLDEMLDTQEHNHFEEIPQYLHMLHHVYRSANYTQPRQYVKCFHDPQEVLILHNHFPLGCLGGRCHSDPVDTGVGHLQHYRQDCVKPLRKSCLADFKSNSVKDTSLWKVKEKVIQRTTEALLQMGFFSSDNNRTLNTAK